MTNSTAQSWSLREGLVLALVNALALLPSFGAGPPGATEHFQLDFPAKPAALTNRPTIGQPEIELSPALAEKLGGAEVANLLVPSIAHLLNQTDRFILTHGKQARCRCIVRLTELEIHQIGRTKFNIGQASQVVGSFFKPKDAGIPSGVMDLCTNINWSNDKLQLSVRCAVSVEILETKNENVLAEDIGEETCTNTAKGISLALGAVVYGKEDGQNGNKDGNASNSSRDYQTRLIQLASYRAMCGLLPKLDQRLLELVDSPVSERLLSEDANTASTSSGGKVFCSNCGKPASSGDKFCTSCGTRLNR